MSLRTEHVLCSETRFRQTRHLDWSVLIQRSSGGDLAPSLGDGNFFRGPRFLNDVFFGKNFHFHAQNFWRPFFSHRPGFSDFPYRYCIRCRIWSFLHKKNHYFRTEFLYDTFFYSVRTFARIRQHYFSKYWGGGCMGRSPPHILGDRPPQSPQVSAPAYALEVCVVIGSNFSGSGQESHWQV